MNSHKDKRTSATFVLLVKVTIVRTKLILTFVFLTPTCNLNVIRPNASCQYDKS